MAGMRVVVVASTSEGNVDLQDLRAKASEHRDRLACLMITYPSTVEGFGNAFIETIYHKRPIVMSTYEIFRTDIQPKGFRVIGFEDFVSSETVAQARQVLDDPGLAAEIADHNYELGRRFYSFATLERRLSLLIQDTLGTEPGAGLFSSS